MATTTINLNLDKEWYTVGTTGADYTTIQAAVNDGKEKLKLITDITTSSDVTLPADFSLVVDLNGFICTFGLNVKMISDATNKVKFTSYSGYRDGEFIFSTDINNFRGVGTASQSIAENIVIRNTSTINLTGIRAYFFFDNKNLTYYFPNAEDHAITNAEGCDLIAGGTSCKWLFAGEGIKDCNILGASKGDFIGRATYLINCKFLLSTFFRVMVYTLASNVTSNGNGRIEVFENASNIYDFDRITMRDNSQIDNFSCGKLGFRNRTNIKAFNGVCEVSPSTGGGNTVLLNGITSLSNIDINNVDYCTVVNCTCVDFKITPNTDFTVVRNLQYTGTATDNSLTTRIFETFLN